ncbi:pentapeptide repeat-containing protein [Nocardioides sp. URHA0020]|uniref:pentapeptide repeat-containing protein n=1 Tax=Nocardioides sp. URHA0020 TaxID=1380392 RepID=UPI00048CDAAC|nr:pentapeptide repeat-containing protein [Nocardioides sp. URHA0020]
MPGARSTTPQTKAPVVARLRLGDLSDGDPVADLVRSADLESVRYTDVLVERLELGGARLDGVRLTRVTADEADLKGARLTEVDLDQVSVPVVRAARGQWRDVQVSGRLGSVEAYESQWRSVHFVGCKLSYLNLRGAELLDVLFTDCVIEELDLVGAAATRVALVDTRVASLDVQGARLGDVDLRRATFDAVDGLVGLRGATLSSDQLTRLAPLLAAELGLRIED